MFMEFFNVEYDLCLGFSNKMPETMKKKEAKKLAKEVGGKAVKISKGKWYVYGGGVRK